MNNQRGLSLVEVLGSIVIIGIVVLMLVTMIQQFALTSRDNETYDQSVAISRNIMEEIRYTLRNSDIQDITISDSLLEVQLSIPLHALRSGQSITLAYPNSSDPKYSLFIRSQSPGLANTHLALVPTCGPGTGDPDDASDDIPCHSINPNDAFRLITIQTTNEATGKVYQLEALIDAPA